MLGRVERCTIRGDVGAVVSVCNLGGCTNGSNLGSGAGVLLIIGGNIF